MHTILILNTVYSATSVTKEKSGQNWNCCIGQFSVFVPYLALERKGHVDKHVFRKWFESVYLSLLIVATNWCCGSKATPCTKLLCSGKIASRWPVMKSKYTCLILKIFVENCVGKRHLYSSHFSGLTKFLTFLDFLKFLSLHWKLYPFEQIIPNSFKYH